MKKRFVFVLLISMLVGIGNAYAQINKQRKMSRFVFETNLGFANGLGKIEFEKRKVSNTIPAFHIHQLAGYQFNNYITVGLGAGIDIWKKNAFIPLFANVSVNFIDRKIVPLWYFNAGYSLKWYVNAEPDPETRVLHGTNPGFYGESGLGIKIKLQERLSLILSANYVMQQSQIKYSVVAPDDVDISMYSTNRSKKVLYHFLGVKLAFRYF